MEIAEIEDPSVEIVVVQEIEGNLSEPEEVKDEKPELFDDAGVGNINSAFKALKEAVDTKKINFTLCNLLVYFGKITSNIEHYKNKVFGYADIAESSNLNNWNLKADKALIFMAISPTENWKIPVGIYFVSNPDVKYIVDIIEGIIRKLHWVGIEVISITLPILPFNRSDISFALGEELGLKTENLTEREYQTYYKHPTTGNSIYIFYDINELLVSMERFWQKSTIIKIRRQTLNYALCLQAKSLNELETIKKGCTAADPSRKYDWIIIKKRLKYDIRFLGKSTADALDYLREMGCSDFKNCEPTIKFLKVLDLISQTSKIDGINDEICTTLKVENKYKWKPLFNNILSYLIKLKNLCKDPDAEEFRIYLKGAIIYFTSLQKINEVYLDSSTNTFPSSFFLLPSRLNLMHIKTVIYKNRLDPEISAKDIFKKLELCSENLITI